jgi:hypothetical protein
VLLAIPLLLEIKISANATIARGETFSFENSINYFLDMPGNCNRTMKDVLSAELIADTLTLEILRSEFYCQFWFLCL